MLNIHFFSIFSIPMVSLLRKETFSIIECKSKCIVNSPLTSHFYFKVDFESLKKWSLACSDGGGEGGGKNVLHRSLSFT